MQSIIPDMRIQEVRRRLLEEIKATRKRIHPDLHPLFNLTMQNKIDHAIRILRLVDRYPNMTVKELLYLIECRIEGEKFVISSYRWSVQMLQEQYNNRDNLERLQFLLVSEAGAFEVSLCCGFESLVFGLELEPSAL
ncbi:MAG: hypothetical protein WBY28_03375 [Nitrososphaeraceae archaeon]